VGGRKEVNFFRVPPQSANLCHESCHGEAGGFQTAGRILEIVRTAEERDGRDQKNSNIQACTEGP